MLLVGVTVKFSQRDLHALVGVRGGDAAADLHGLSDRTHLGRRTLRIVVRGDDELGARHLQHLDQVAYALVAPTDLEHRVSVLSLDDQNVRASAELDEIALKAHTLFEVLPVRVELFVVIDHDHDLAAVLEAVAEAAARVVEELGLDDDVVIAFRGDHVDATIFDERAVDLRVEHFRGDRERVIVEDLLAHHASEALPAPEVAGEVGMEQRGEEPEPFPVVAVQVREEDVSLDLLARAQPRHQLVAELPDATTRVQDEELPTDGQLQTTRLSTDLDVVSAGRTPHAPELEDKVFQGAHGSTSMLPPGSGLTICPQHMALLKCVQSVLIMIRQHVIISLC